MCPANAPIRALIIDKDQVFGSTLAALLAPQIMVRAIHAGIDHALSDLADGTALPIILIDPGPVGIVERTNVLGRLRAAAPASGLMVLSQDLSDAAIRTSLRFGMDAHIAKGSSLDVMKRAIQLVALGQNVYPAAAAGLWPEEGPARPTESPAALSPREMQILACLLGGQSNKAIARRLSITESTVKMHFKSVMRKVRASNRTQAAVWAIDNGIAPMTA